MFSFSLHAHTLFAFLKQTGVSFQNKKSLVLLLMAPTVQAFLIVNLSYVA